MLGMRLFTMLYGPHPGGIPVSCQCSCALLWLQLARAARRCVQPHAQQLQGLDLGASAQVCV